MFDREHWEIYTYGGGVAPFMAVQSIDFAEVRLNLYQHTLGGSVRIYSTAFR